MRLGGAVGLAVGWWQGEQMGGLAVGLAVRLKVVGWGMGRHAVGLANKWVRIWVGLLVSNLAGYFGR